MEGFQLLAPLVGFRVVRGPDWECGEEDGGEGHVGTVVDVGGGRSVEVQWDCGERGSYRCGEGGKYDLRIFDSGPAGLKHPDESCNGCHEEGVEGIAWRCTQCCDYVLCSACYMAGRHTTEHQFTCIVIAKRGQKGWHARVPPRQDVRMIPVMGIFPEAQVVRGPHWRWKNQDGHPGNLGKVIALRGWNNQTARSVVEVQWQGNSKMNIYRVGHKGKVDLKCTVPGSGGGVYLDHLPILGAPFAPPGPKDFSSGDRIKADLDMDIFKSLEAGGAGLGDQICLLLDHIGTVNSMMDSGDLLVRYPTNALLPVNPEAANKVDSPLYEVGDAVRVIDDIAEVYRLQKGHGEWNDDMALALGQVGVVMKEFHSGDVQIGVGGRRWTFNACCLLPAPGERPPDDTPPPAIEAEAHLQLLTLTSPMTPDVVVLAATAGDVGTLTNYLQRAPHEVNARFEGKTAVHAAVEEGHTHILRALLQFSPNLELEDGEGERPIQACAFHNQAEAAKVLLEAGADVNSQNRKGNTALMISAAVGHYKALKIFAFHPAINLHVQDNVGSTALHHAIVSQRTKSVCILMEAGADATRLNFRLFAPIHDAAGFGFLPAVEEFVTRQPQLANLKRPDDGHTALHIAAANNRLDTLTLLASIRTTDINVRNDLRRTPLHTAVIEGYPRVIERLVGYGAELNIVEDEGNTPLHIILIKKTMKPINDDTSVMNKVRNELLGCQQKGSVPHYLVVACFLAQEGADMHLKNKRGHSPMQLCPSDSGMLMINFVNKSVRGSFHGSLRAGHDAQGPLTAPAGDQVTPSGATASTSASNTTSQPASATPPPHPTPHPTPLPIPYPTPLPTPHPTSLPTPHLILPQPKQRVEETPDPEPPTSGPATAASSSVTPSPSTPQIQPQWSTQPHIPPLSETSQPKPQWNISQQPPTPFSPTTGQSSSSGAIPIGTHLPPSSQSQQPADQDITTAERGQRPAQPKDGAHATEPCFLCESPADMTFQPCGHNVMCSQCSTRAKRCPTCRTPIQSAHQMKLTK